MRKQLQVPMNELTIFSTYAKLNLDTLYIQQDICPCVWLYTYTMFKLKRINSGTFYL